MGKGMTWTREECDTLKELWGEKSIPTICRRLGRSPNAIRLKAGRLGLGLFTQSGDYITYNELMRTVTARDADSYDAVTLIEKRGMPVRNKRVDRKTVRIIMIDDFWKWAEGNMSFLDFSKFEKNTLGGEPDWVDQKRRSDIEWNRKYTTAPWTAAEDERLKRLVGMYRYTYSEISHMTGRTCGAVQRRLIELGVKGRPLKAAVSKWSDDEKRILRGMVAEGANYERMSEALGRSSKAVRGEVYRIYGTENLDKARADERGML